jgi:hypothetical protein
LQVKTLYFSMVGKAENRIISGIGDYGLPAGFFAFFFVYLLVCIDPSIICTCNGFDLYSYVHYTASGEISKANIVDHHRYGDHRYILELTPVWLKGIVAVPGGMTTLLVTFAVYLCHYPAWGALAITFFAWLLYFLFPAYIRRCGGHSFLICRYLPPLFLLAVCARFELNYLAYLIPITGALIFSIIYQRLPLRFPVRRQVAFFLLFWAMYWLFQWAALLFAVFVLLYEGFRHARAFFISCISAVFNSAVLFAAEHHLLPVEQAIHADEFFLPIVPPIAVIAYFPFVALAAHPVAARFLWRKERPSVPVRTGSRLLRSFAVIIAAAGFLFWSMHDPDLRNTRTLARTLHFVQNGQWEKVLGEKTPCLIEKLPVVNDPLQHIMVNAVDHALYRTGRLGEEMFFHPQAAFSSEPLLLFKNTLTYGHMKWALSLDLFLELGLLNFSEKVAAELVECMGPYPWLIYRCALIQAAKGDNEASKVYLQKLRRMPFYRKEAERLLRLLDDDAAPALDSRIAILKACADTADYFIYQTDEETMLCSLLNRNPANRAAYEYLMAHYLLTGTLKKFTDKISRAADFGYHDALPRHWEEALCIYAYEDSATSSMQKIPLHGETVAALRRYLEAYAPYENDPEKELLAASRLKAEFGATYFYFYTFLVNHGAAP